MNPNSNYRVISRPYPGEPGMRYYEVCEVFYNAAGEPTRFLEGCTIMTTDDDNPMLSLSGKLHAFQYALGRDVLHEEDFST